MVIERHDILAILLLLSAVLVLAATKNY